MIVLEITKIQHTQDGGKIEAAVGDSFAKGVPIDSANAILGITSMGTILYVDNHGAFTALHIGEYYLLSEEELKAVHELTKTSSGELRVKIKVLEDEIRAKIKALEGAGLPIFEEKGELAILRRLQ